MIIYSAAVGMPRPLIYMATAPFDPNAVQERRVLCNASAPDDDRAWRAMGSGRGGHGFFGTEAEGIAWLLEGETTTDKPPREQRRRKRREGQAP